MPSKRRDVAKSRLANKTIWNLEEILAACVENQRLMDEMMDLAEKKMDTKMLLLLARLNRSLTFIQRKAQHARSGEYHEER